MVELLIPSPKPKLRSISLNLHHDEDCEYSKVLNELARLSPNIEEIWIQGGLLEHFCHDKKALKSIYVKVEWYMCRGGCNLFAIAIYSNYLQSTRDCRRLCNCNLNC